MKIKITHLLLEAAFFMSSQFAFGQSYCYQYNLVSFIPGVGGKIVVKLSINGSTAFKLGTSSLFFNFNQTTLSAPTLKSSTLDGNSNYATTTIVNSAQNLEVVNVVLNSSNNGITIGTSPTEIAQLEFTVLDNSTSTDFSVNTQFTEVYLDNNATKIGVTSGCGNTNVALPLTWLDFQAKLNPENNNVDLTWLTAQEVNVKNYGVQRSSDGKNFELIGKTVTANNVVTQSTYTAVDETPNAGVNYYRVLATDFDGRLSYSLVRSVNVGIVTPQFKLFPNPAKANTALYIETNYREIFDFQLTDIAGKIICQKQNLIGKHVELTNMELSAGNYIFECRANGKKTIGKLVVVN